jgi:hypothetical protein
MFHIPKISLLNNFNFLVKMIYIFHTILSIFHYFDNAHG